MEETLIKIAKEAGPLVAIALLIGWRASSSIGRFLDRFLASIDKMTAKIDDNSVAIREHAAADAKVVRAIERLDGKLEGVMLERETTPIGVPVPRGRAAISDSDHPPLGAPNRDDETPSQRRAGGYAFRRKDKS